MAANAQRKQQEQIQKIQEIVNNWYKTPETIINSSDSSFLNYDSISKVWSDTQNVTPLTPLGLRQSVATPGQTPLSNTQLRNTVQYALNLKHTPNQNTLSRLQCTTTILYANDNFIAGSIQSNLEKPYCIQNIGFLDFLKIFNPYESLWFVIRKSLASNSANAEFTDIEIVNVDTRNIIQECFVKVQINSGADDLTIDNLIGFVLSKLEVPAYIKHFTKFLHCFISLVTDANSFEPHKRLGSRGQNDQICRVNVQEKLSSSYQSVDAFLKTINDTDANKVITFLKMFEEFCTNMLKLGAETGFVHNDAHLGNVFYAPNDNIILIDYGRVKFSKHIWEIFHKAPTTRSLLDYYCALSFHVWEPFIDNNLAKFQKTKYVDAYMYSFYFDIATMAMNILRDSEIARTQLENWLNSFLNAGTKLFEFSPNRKDVTVPHINYLRRIVRTQNLSIPSHLKFLLVGLITFAQAASMIIINSNGLDYVLYSENFTKTTMTFYMDELYRYGYIYYMFQFLDVSMKNDHNIDLFKMIVSNIQYISKITPTVGGRKRVGAGVLSTTVRPGKTTAAPIPLRSIPLRSIPAARLNTPGKGSPFAPNTLVLPANFALRNVYLGKPNPMGSLKNVKPQSKLNNAQTQITEMYNKHLEQVLALEQWLETADKEIIDEYLPKSALPIPENFPQWMMKTHSPNPNPNRTRPQINNVVMSGDSPYKYIINFTDPDIQTILNNQIVSDPRSIWSWPERNHSERLWKFDTQS